MKPIKLVMSAFGPYKDRVIVDFEKLGSDGIFLITGDTGSGKTTIFDALSFALFGEASGSRRENSSFRSDFASSDVNTYVELEFVHKDVIYKVERSPKYTRKKKKGDGFTSVGGEATLEFLDEVISGDKNVTDKCVEILGMNSKQFKQIVMVAQGEFMELLFAKTKDRASIFRHIFDTGVYKSISDNLKNKYLNKKREYEDTEILIKGYINGMQLDNEVLDIESASMAIELLDRELACDRETEENLEVDREKLLKEQTRIVKFITEGKLVNDSIIELDKYKEKLNELLESKDLFEEKKELIDKNKNIWDKLMPIRTELNNLNKELDSKNNSLIENKREYISISNSYDNVLGLYNGIDDKLKEVLNHNKEIDKIKGKLELLEEIANYRSELDELYKKINYFKLEDKKVLLGKIDKFIELEKELDLLRNDINNKKNEYITSNELYNKHYDLFISASAGILALTLKENKRCPVCGSLDHPCKATLSDEVLTKEELDSEKKELESKYKFLENLRLELLNKDREVELLKLELNNLDRDVLVSEINGLEKLVSEIFIDESDNLLEIEKRIQKLEVIVNEKIYSLSEEDSFDKLNEKIEGYNNKINIINNEVNDIKLRYDELLKKKTNINSLINLLEGDIGKIYSAIAKLEKDYITSYNKLGYSNEDEYLRIMLDKYELDRLDEEVKDYYDELLKVNSNIEGFEKIINGKELVVLDNYEEELNLVNKRLEEINVSLKNVCSKISNNEKVYNNLYDVSQKTTKLEKEVMIYKDLSDTANGSITGKSKLEFEQYVQASYFDRVLMSANKRLGYMTDERYQLVRKEEATKISDKLGLELEIMDYYTGKNRDIKSLSGGESFKASLALALGMSDTIQEYSGGVVVEAMFIDEGFGSLDDESLEQAMNAIMGISGGNKLIGIISHVNELKSRIDKKIVVNKTSSGSNVSIVV